jgi:hypothetical protein
VPIFASHEKRLNLSENRSYLFYWDILIIVFAHVNG